MPAIPSLRQAWRGWLAAGVVLAFLIFVSRPLWLGPTAPAFAVKRSELVQTVVASGHVESPLRVDIGSQITGQVANVPVAEGETVKAGTLLIALDSSDEQAAVEQARATLAQAEAKLKQIRELSAPVARQALLQAEATLDNAQKQYDRTQDLAAKGFIGKSQLDDALRALDVARTQVATAALQLKSNRPDGSDYLIAQTNLQQARASLRSAEAKLAHTRIAAPADGTLISRNVERGDVVQPGKVLMVLSPSGRTQLVVQIDEKNLRYLSVGQRGLAAADAYPGRKFDVELAYINPGIDASRGSVEVKLNVSRPPDFLRQDMTVSVDIDALTLPIEAVHDAAGASPWVMLVVNGRTEKRRIKIGARGDTRLEIIDGLIEGDLVLPATGVGAPEGTRLRATAK
jgi:HlyD family secretion protein